MASNRVLLKGGIIMVNYAQIDEKNIVIGISQLKGKIDNPNMIELGEYDHSILGKLYENGKFIDMDYYAELNNESIVIDIVSNPNNKSIPKSWSNKIPIEHQDYSLIGCKYIDGEFVIIDPTVEAIKNLTSVVENLTNQIEDLKNNLNNQ